MPYADDDGVSLYYETDDPATDDPATDDPETVALVEGLGDGRWMWRWQRDRLTGEQSSPSSATQSHDADEGYRVVVWDNRGTVTPMPPRGRTRTGESPRRRPLLAQRRGDGGDVRRLLRERSKRRLGGRAKRVLRR